MPSYSGVIKIFIIGILTLSVGVLHPQGEDANVNNYYVERRSYGTKRIDGTRPDYAKRLSETGIGAFKNFDWLIAGIDYRYRQEYRDNDLRRPNATTTIGPAGVAPQVDLPALLRTRLFLKVENILDPFRFTVEIEDARRYPYWNPADDPGKNPRQPPYAADDRDFNYGEPIQAFGEFYFPHLFGHERPFNVRLGRMAFEFLDRRLVALNEWRNTTNTFQGLRLTIGQEKNDWYVELLAVQPLVRYIHRLDNVQGRQWFYGAILSLQQYSTWLTLQPFYLALQQNSQSPTPENPELIQRDFQHIHTAGIRAYAVWAKSGIDYDFSCTGQWGTDALRANGDEIKQAAWATTGELGYSAPHRARPRLALFYGYISGDFDRTDKVQNRFNRLFGFARPWSAHDYFQMENLSTPKIIFEFNPWENLRLDTAYAWYWVASPKDRWNNAQILRNATAEGNANSETKLGEEYNIRLRSSFAQVQLKLGYAFFRPGAYTIKFLRGGDSHFVYVELSLSLWGYATH